MLTRRRAIATVALATPVLARPARAQPRWPERPVTIIAPFAPGGGVDLNARIAARFLEKHAGGAHPFVVSNRPGAGGEIGWLAVADGAPDGQTLALMNLPGNLSIPIERPNSRLRADSLIAVATLAEDPGVITVHAESPHRTLPDLIAAMKARPGQVSYGTAGVGAAGHIAMLFFGQAAGVEGLHVPFNGSAQVNTALLGRQIEVGTPTFAEASAFTRGGNAALRVLGVMAAERLPQMPDWPAFGEYGMPGVRGGSVRGLGVARGTPPALVEQIGAAIARMVADPDYAAALAQVNLPPRYLDTAATAAMMRDYDARLRALWAASPWNK